MSEAKPQTPDLVKELDVPVRFGVAREWALAAKEVAEATQDPQALRVWSFIDDRTTLAVPMPEGGIHYFFTEKPERPANDYAFLVPIIDADKERLPADDFRRKMAEGNGHVAAQYREGSHAIYLPPRTMGKLGKGILMLHEGMHAQLDLDKLVNRELENSHWIEEAEVFKFEFKLLSKILGDPYAKLVNRISQTISGAEDDPNQLSANYEISESDKKLISEGLMTTNDEEIKFWINSVTKLNAFWEYFKHNFERPDIELAIMLKAMYTRRPNEEDVLH